jgi:Putative metallopeptidase
MKRRLLTVLILIFLAARSALSLYQSPEASAELGRQYEGGGVAFRYPKGWEARDSKGMLVVAPADAHTRLASGEEWITRGLMMGLSHPTSNAGLWVSTAELFKALQGSSPAMKQVGAPKSFEVDSQTASLLEYTNTSPGNERSENGLLLTVRSSAGLRFWLMFCAAGERPAYFPLFSDLIQTIRFVGNDSASGVQQPSVVHSVLHIEPSVTLVRGSTEVQAGNVTRYTLALKRGSKLVAKFTVEGGINNRIDVWLLDTENYQRYSAGQEFSYFKGTSGLVRGVDRYEFAVPKTDNYYLLLDNRRAWLLSRNVELYVYEILPEATPETRSEEKQFDTLYQQLKSVFIFPDFQINIRHCGTENAFSSPDITLCTELIESLKEQKLESAITFVFFHELGHTLMRGWDLPIYDNEDDADQFATVFLIMSHRESGALQAAQRWAAQTSEQEALAKIWVDDRHTLSAQRARNIIRWLNNQQELVRQWQRILVPNVQTEALLEELKTGEFDKDLVRGELRKRGVAAP